MPPPVAAALKAEPVLVWRTSYVKRKINKKEGFLWSIKSISILSDLARKKLAE